MGTRATFLTSPFGRRLFGVFVASALLPVIVLAGVSYYLVSGELESLANERLHRAARATGHELARKLLLAASELPEPAADIPYRWRAVERPDGSWLDPAGAPAPAWWHAPGSDVALPRLQVPVAPDGAHAVLIRRNGDAARVAGEPDPRWLFDISHQNSLPTHGGFLVVVDGRLIATSFEDVGPLPSAWTIVSPERNLGEWSHAGDDFRVRSWSLFLEAGLRSDPWTILVTEPVHVAAAPLGAFRVGFAAALGLTLLVVPLLATRQLRLRLRPLDALRAGARRVARRDLGARVQVESTDEFAEVATAFNQMAESLGEHFGAFERLLSIDREILGADHEQDIVDAVLRRAPEFAACECCAFLELRSPEEATVVHHFLDPARGVPNSLEPVVMSPAALDFLSTDRQMSASEVDAEILAPLAQEQISYVAVLPLAAGGQTTGALVLGFSDEARLRAEQMPYLRQLAHQAAAAMSNLREREHSRVIASYDAITGLPNRRVLRERLGQALLSEAPRGAQVAVCVVSLLALPRIQRALGHVVGEAAFHQAAYRLLRALPGSDAFHLSDGDLAVVFSGPLERDALYRLVAEIVRALAVPIDLVEATGLRLDPCAGVAVFPHDGHSADLLIRNAAEASREAHEARGAPVRFYSVEGGAASRSAIELESSLGSALERGEIQVAYQPIVDANSLGLMGAEALMRWTRPDGPVSPGEFIPVAERTGLIRELGEFVMDEACGFLGAGIARGLPPIQLHVNVSPHQLRDDGLFHTVQSALLGGGLTPSDLVLELTETMETDGDDETARLLDRVRALGVRLAVDDFGTGYASFDYLRRFSISTLKIDMCFVKQLPDDATNAAIVRAILALADGFQLKVVAEGVENEAQLAFLREAGCHELQGFLFAEPLAPDAFAKRWEEAADRGEIG